MDYVIMAMGAVLLVAGCALFLRSRRGPGGVTDPTTLVLALSLTLLGYHLLAWMLPERWVPLRIPASLWPLLAGGIAIAIAGALVADALEKQRDEDDQP